MKPELETIHAQSRAAWRKWLLKHHGQAESVWLRIAKKGHKGVFRMEAVEEALCFGWIDSRPALGDEAYYLLLMSPRKPKSVWSKINKALIEKLIKTGLMHPSGLAKIQAAKQSGTWETLTPIDDLEIPLELKKALAKNSTARKNFEAFPPSAKKQILYWLQSARTSETKQKRIAETVAKAHLNERANEYKKKTKAGG